MTSSKLAGIITRADLMRALDQDSSGNMTVLQAGSHKLVVTYPDEVLYDAAARMLRANVGRMPVVSREDSRANRRIPGTFGNHGCTSAPLGRRARA